MESEIVAEQSNQEDVESFDVLVEFISSPQTNETNEDTPGDMTQEIECEDIEDTSRNAQNDNIITQENDIIISSNESQECKSVENLVADGGHDDDNINQLVLDSTSYGFDNQQLQKQFVPDDQILSETQQQEQQHCTIESSTNDMEIIDEGSTHQPLRNEEDNNVNEQNRIQEEENISVVQDVNIFTTFQENKSLDIQEQEIPASIETETLLQSEEQQQQQALIDQVENVEASEQGGTQNLLGNLDNFSHDEDMSVDCVATTTTVTETKTQESPFLGNEFENRIQDNVHQNMDYFSSGNNNNNQLETEKNFAESKPEELLLLVATEDVKIDADKDNEANENPFSVSSDESYSTYSGGEGSSNPFSATDDFLSTQQQLNEGLQNPFSAIADDSFSTRQQEPLGSEINSSSQDPFGQKELHEGYNNATNTFDQNILSGHYEGQQQQQGFGITNSNPFGNTNTPFNEQKEYPSGINPEAPEFIPRSKKYTTSFTPLIDTFSENSGVAEGEQSLFTAGEGTTNTQKKDELSIFDPVPSNHGFTNGNSTTEHGVSNGNTKVEKSELIDPEMVAEVNRSVVELSHGLGGKETSANTSEDLYGQTF